jgi:hypothetical protein
MLLLSCLASSNSRYIPLFNVIENSHTISKIKIIDSEKIMVDKNFYCGSNYKYKSIKNYRGETNEGIFWNTGEYKLDHDYLAFFTNSSSIINSRIDEFKQYYKDDMDVAVLSSMQKCAQLIPEVGIYGSGSGIFKVRNNKYHEFIAIDSHYVVHYYKNRSEQTKCHINSSESNKRIKMKCIEQLIKDSNIKLDNHYQKFLKGILENAKK